MAPLSRHDRLAITVLRWTSASDLQSFARQTVAAARELQGRLDTAATGTYLLLTDLTEYVSLASPLECDRGVLHLLLCNSAPSARLVS